MKFQASFLPEMSLGEFTYIFGPMEVFAEDGQTVYITREFKNVEQLKTLCGTFQGRLERAGMKFTGAVVQPFGTKPPVDPKKYRVSSPLKVHLDYNRGTDFDPIMYELRPHLQKHYGTDLLHPETVIIPPNQHYPQGLTEQQIVDYYGKVEPQIIKQYAQYGLDALVRMKVDDRVIIKRNAKISVSGMQITSREEFDNLNQGRTVEFHFAIGETTPMVWVDLDPKDGFPFNDVKAVASELAEELVKMPESDHVEVRFSGGDGMHVICFMKKPMPTDESKKELDKFVGGYLERKQDDRLTQKATHDKNMMRLDTSTFHRTGGLRTAYSLAYPTGLVCLPIPLDFLSSFQKGDATMDKALSGLQTTAELKQPQDVIQLLTNWRSEKKLPEDLNEIQQLKALITNERARQGMMVHLWEYYDPDLTVEVIAGIMADMELEAERPYRLAKAAGKFEGDLTEYQRKRDFGTTAEPEGQVAEETKTTFVIQEHHAHVAKLHFDLRLAHGGVLKSWAVPKLMSLVSGEKPQVLAIETEDHPMEYATFEGSSLQTCERKMVALGMVADGIDSKASIPSGEYGGGTMSIWDEGTYKTLSQDEDHWKFEFQGSRMKGPFVLFRTGGDKWNLRRSKETEK